MPLIVIEAPSEVAVNPAGSAKPLLTSVPPAVAVNGGVPPEIANVREYGTLSAALTKFDGLTVNADGCDQGNLRAGKISIAVEIVNPGRVSSGVRGKNVRRLHVCAAQHRIFKIVRAAGRVNSNFASSAVAFWVNLRSRQTQIGRRIDNGCRARHRTVRLVFDNDRIISGS